MGEKMLLWNGSTVSDDIVNYIKTLIKGKKTISINELNELAKQANVNINVFYEILASHLGFGIIDSNLVQSNWKDPHLFGLISRLSNYSYQSVAKAIKAFRSKHEASIIRGNFMRALYAVIVLNWALSAFSEIDPVLWGRMSPEATEKDIQLTIDWILANIDFEFDLDSVAISTTKQLDELQSYIQDLLNRLHSGSMSQTEYEELQYLIDTLTEGTNIEYLPRYRELPRIDELRDQQIQEHIGDFTFEDLRVLKHIIENKYPEIHPNAIKIEAEYRNDSKNVS